MIVVRFKETGEVQEFVNDFAMYLIESGQAERVSATPERPAAPVQAAAIVPQTEKAARIGRPEYSRGPIQRLRPVA